MIKIGSTFELVSDTTRTILFLIHIRSAITLVLTLTLNVSTIASIARKIYIRGGIGTGEFRKIYGGRQRRGMKPSRSSKASGGLIRNAMQQLERLGVIEKDPRGGRRLTVKGQAEMDTQASQCLSSNA